MESYMMPARWGKVIESLLEQEDIANIELLRIEFTPINFCNGFYRLHGEYLVTPVGGERYVIYLDTQFARFAPNADVYICPYDRQSKATVEMSFPD